MLRILVAGSLLLAATALASAAVAAQHAHVHGTARINVVVEGSAATVEFIAPTDGIYGFERAPRTDAERRQREAGLQRLRGHIAKMVVFEADRGCRFDVTQLADAGAGDGGPAHAHDHGGGAAHRHAEHREVHAEYAVQCRRPLAGSNLRFGVTGVFPGIREVDVQILSDSGQTGLKVVRDRGGARL
jgi:hypothetical protein